MHKFDFRISDNRAHSWLEARVRERERERERKMYIYIYINNEKQTNSFRY